VNVERVEEKLLTTNAKQLSDKTFVNKFAKEMIEGEECTLTCRLIDAEAALGRSTVIDLNTSSSNKFR